MIPRSADWKNALATAVRDPAELLALLELPREWLGGARQAARGFPLRVPRGYVARMAKGDPADPLLRQVLPLGLELEIVPGFVRDPVGDLNAATGPGVLQKYRARALLIATGACAIHCRYCFRRHFPYADENAGRNDWQPALTHLGAHPQIREVILSGGDPLLLDDGRLSELVEALGAVPHLERLRIHTRVPVVLPERVNEPLLALLETSRLQCVVVIHANHANELDAPVEQALRRLRQTGALLFNQSVLLKGVNDRADILGRLSEALLATGVVPYYLHLLDRVEGSAHFEVGEAEAKRLMVELRETLPGYMVPRLVREVEGAAFKLPLL